MRKIALAIVIITVAVGCGGSPQKPPAPAAAPPTPAAAAPPSQPAVESPAAPDMPAQPAAEPAQIPAEAPAAPPAEAPDALAAPAADKPPVQAPAGTKVAFVPNNPSDFWKIAEAGTMKAAQDFGVEVLFRIPSMGTAEQQMQIVQDMITNGVSGVAISPVDPANQTAFLNEVASRVHLVTQDSDAQDSQRLCYIGTDNYQAGREAGKLVQQCVPMGMRLMVFVGSMDAQNAQDRLRGLKDQLESTEHAIYDVRTDDGDRARAIANVEDAALTHPEVACFIGLWSYNGPAILNGLKSVNRLGAVRVVCFDEEEETLQGVQDGVVFGTVVQQPYEFGYQSVRVLAELAAGDTSSIPDGRQLFIPTLSITQDNVGAFWKDLKARLGKS